MLKSHIGVFHSENIREINNVQAEYYCVYADLYFGTLVIFFLSDFKNTTYHCVT